MPAQIALNMLLMPGPQVIPVQMLRKQEQVIDNGLVS